MNNKKFLLIPIILMLFMIIISSASAGELNTAEDLAIDEELSIDNGDSINLDEELEDNAISTENEELEETQSDNSKETLSDSNSITVTDKTFEGIQAAIDEANENDTIILDGYYDIYPIVERNYDSYNSNMNLYYYNPININKTLNIVGINNATLFYNGVLRDTIDFGGSFFYITADNVTFKGITFVNGSCGAKIVDGWPDYIHGKGGAIYSDKYMEITNCTFINNTASEQGGAIYARTANIDNCKFINDKSSSKSGGAICFNYGRGLITDCYFENCSSPNFGGAIVGDKDYTNVSNCIFNSCRSGSAGAIYSCWGINNCTFINNSAKSEGGAIYYCGEISNSTFINNSATHGGACSRGDFNHCFVINNCSFRDNHALEKGGAIFSNKTSCIIDSCNFTGSYVTEGYGGSIFFENSTDLNITNCNFTDSSALYGGSIAIDELCSSLSITLSNFNSNYATHSGGAIYFLGFNGTIFNTNFINNTSLDSGGAIYTEFCNLLIINGSSFTNNSVLTTDMGDNRNGGAICCLAKQGIIMGSEFKNNSALDSGGAIFISNDTISINVTDCVFEQNSISSDYFGENHGGGAICTISKSIIINVCSFISNSASNSYGGAIYFNCHDDTLVGKNRLNSNAVSASSSASAIKKSVFKYNDAFRANAVYAVEPVDLLFNNITFRPEETLEDLFYGISLDDIYSNNDFAREKGKSVVSASAVTSYYGKTFSVKVNSNNATGIKYTIKNSKGTQVKSGTISPGASITGLSFAPGTYTVTLTTVVDENHTSSSATSKITVNKATANITASALTTYYNSGKTWSITLKDKTNGKVLASKKLTLKVYTGSKYKTYTVTTNSKGVATFKASTLAPGSHKVVVSYSNSNYTTKSLTKTLKINKMTLSYKVSKSTQKDGAGLHVWVKNKATGKLINKIKIKLLVYTGKKYKTITLVSAKYSNKGNGYTGYAVKGPVYSVGTHTVKIMAGDSYHTGSVKSSLVLKSTVKKYSKKTIIISKGKRTVK